jgi:HEAT repeat protein
VRAAAGVVLGVLGLLLWRVPGAIQNGWWSQVPTSALIVTLQVWDDDDLFQRVRDRLTGGARALPGWEKWLLARHCSRILEKPDVTLTPSAAAPSAPGGLVIQGGGGPNQSAAIRAYMLSRFGTVQAHAQAMELLMQMGPSARPAVPALISLLDNPVDRMSALQVLEKIGPRAAAAIEPVVALTNDPLFRDYHQAFATLKAIFASTDSAMSAAERVIQSKADLFVKLDASHFIADTFPAVRSIPVFEQLMTDPDLLVRIAAARGLEKMGTRADPAVPAIAWATRDPKCPLEAVGVNVLTSIGDETAIAALAELAGDPNPEVARPAASALGTIGPRAASAVPALIRALKHPDPFVPPHAANSLGLIGSGDAMAALRELAADAGAPGSHEAGRALELIRSVARTDAPTQNPG